MRHAEQSGGAIVARAAKHIRHVYPARRAKIKLTKNICGERSAYLAYKRRTNLFPCPLVRDHLPPPRGVGIGLLNGDDMMDDIIWLTVIVGLLAATLVYVRLCDAA